MANEGYHEPINELSDESGNYIFDGRAGGSRLV